MVSAENWLESNPDNMETEEEIFYIPRSLLYQSMSSPSGSGLIMSGTPLPPGARLVTWRPDMNKSTTTIERRKLKPKMSTPSRSMLVTWVPKQKKQAAWDRHAAWRL